MKNYQHQPLRKPEGWTGQDAALVIQLERQLDDIYRKLGALKEKLGDVADLTTTEKSSTVAALNEINEKLIGKQVTMTKTSSVVTEYECRLYIYGNILAGNARGTAAFTDGETVTLWETDARPVSPIYTVAVDSYGDYIGRAILSSDGGVKVIPSRTISTVGFAITFSGRYA